MEYETTTTTTIKKGDRVVFRPEWQDDGDADVVFVAVEDPAGELIRVEALLGMTVNPQQVVPTFWIESAETIPGSPEFHRGADGLYFITDTETGEQSDSAETPSAALAIWADNLAEIKRRI